MKRTKIVATIGPASQSVDVLEDMMAAGMNVARLNFSHGTHSHHAMLINNIREASKKQDKPIAIIQDLQGARIRIGDIGKQGITIARGERVIIVSTNNPKKITKNGRKIIPVDYPNLEKTVAKGKNIFIDNGLIKLVVEEVSADYLQCVSESDGTIGAHKGVNLPYSNVNLPAITKKDLQDIDFGIAQKVDFIALSFVRTAEDVKKLKKIIKSDVGAKNAKNYGIIVKIEHPDAVKNFDKILQEADAIMIARGDLGIEMSTEQVPLLQKELVAKCLSVAKPVIVATHMLESMTENTNPTRAEASDVANAVIDHTDAIMLSGETANGKYPVKTIEMMATIIQATEESAYDDLLDREYDGEDSAIEAAVSILAEGTKAKAILVITSSGKTAKIISRFRPEMPIITATKDTLTMRKLILSWGVFPFVAPNVRVVDKLIEQSIVIIKKKNIVQKEDKIIIIAGQPFSESKKSGAIRIEQV